ncbi:hypothetical protein SAV31267_100310 [Streptomyces avermitilis]|uniref:Uncharacterized protein n=2 Tax=Streptomyces avermitilis TaxID=33903 RepID=A0A143T2C7_STRAW|nr:hypothetical protein SAVERM_2p128 [Streptomyces avermitilis MA-4680 = NBRC 14893]GDY80546.1 hypothetical protein SAV31267_100310 [Streptomyces avermitilis]
MRCRLDVLQSRVYRGQLRTAVRPGMDVVGFPPPVATSVKWIRQQPQCIDEVRLTGVVLPHDDRDALTQRNIHVQQRFEAFGRDFPQVQLLPHFPQERERTGSRHTLKGNQYRCTEVLGRLRRENATPYNRVPGTSWLILRARGVSELGVRSLRSPWR